jgi:hypothetical protein
MSGTEGNMPDNTADIRTMEFSEKNLFSTLSNDKCMKRLTDVNISYLYNYLTHLKCSTIVTEAPYVDRDFLDDYCSYYVRCFRDYSRFCKRVHFFSRFDVGAFESYLDGRSDAKSLLKKLKNKYLGYVVAKPLPSAIIGRTVLRLWEDTVTECNDELGKRSIRCVRSYTPNLAGLDLKVRGLAFQEQDRVLAACATSALWSAFHRTAEAFDHPIPSLYEITVGSSTGISERIHTHEKCELLRVSLSLDGK